MLTVKPLSAFDELDKYFFPQSTTSTLYPHDKLTLDLNAPVITVVREGIFKTERSQEDILVAISPAPMIFGLPGVLAGRKETYQVTALTQCEIYQIDASVCKALLEQHQLWREAFEWISWILRVQMQRDIQLIGKNSYSQIRATLQTMSSWDETLRTRVGVMNFIQQRTHISRSVIAEVLAALRAGNYIKMDKGKLISINRLPLEY